MATAGLESLLSAGSDGLSIDDLEITREADGYRFSIATLERTGLSASELRRTLNQYPEYVSNYRYWKEVGGDGTARRAFLRWCEHAPIEGQASGGHGHDQTHPVLNRYNALTEGISREWGQVQITVHLADRDTGSRRYGLRHVDDAGTADSQLEAHTDPREAREIVTFDDLERYRPLKTAPTLVGGWQFPDLTGSELVETVEFIYPATIANWHRERQGELDVDHWIDTAERQTGIYDVIDELPPEAVDWMVEACCADSQCLRRREWEYDEDHEIDADGGGGVFPCREPCSLVVAAARKWTVLESEEPKAWELEVTTSEKNQLMELIDAVADGRIDEIREADVYKGANRYRTRYLRSKYADEEEGLPIREVDHDHGHEADDQTATQD